MTNKDMVPRPGPGPAPRSRSEPKLPRKGQLAGGSRPEIDPPDSPQAPPNQDRK